MDGAFFAERFGYPNTGISSFPSVPGKRLHSYGKSQFWWLKQRTFYGNFQYQTLSWPEGYMKIPLNHHFVLCWRMRWCCWKRPRSCAQGSLVGTTPWYMITITWLEETRNLASVISCSMGGKHLASCIWHRLPEGLACQRIFARWDSRCQGVCKKWQDWRSWLHKCGTQWFSGRLHSLGDEFGPDCQRASSSIRKRLGNPSVKSWLNSVVRSAQCQWFLDPAAVSFVIMCRTWTDVFQIQGITDKQSLPIHLKTLVGKKAWRNFASKSPTTHCATNIVAKRRVKQNASRDIQITPKIDRLKRFP